MSHERNIKQLNLWRIIYRRDPINDVPTIETDKYKYYEDGTYECYHLFNTKAKITTYKSLKWHMLVLYYLNNYDGLPINNLPHVFKFIANKENGFVTFFISHKKLTYMIDEVLTQAKKEYQVLLPKGNELKSFLEKNQTKKCTMQVKLLLLYKINI